MVIFHGKRLVITCHNQMVYMIAIGWPQRPSKQVLGLGMLKKDASSFWLVLRTVDSQMGMDQYLINTIFRGMNIHLQAILM